MKSVNSGQFGYFKACVHGYLDTNSLETPTKHRHNEQIAFRYKLYINFVDEKNSQVHDWYGHADTVLVVS